MGKRITSRARGHGSLTFRVRPRAYIYRVTYPSVMASGKAKILKLINSSAHYAPLAKIQIEKEFFICPAASGIYEGQEILINQLREDKKPANGDILRLKDIPVGTKIFDIETVPGNGGKILRSSGISAIVLDSSNGKVEIQIKRRRISLNEDCRATIGVAAGEGRLMKPIVKAGKKHHMMKSKGRKWHRTSAIKTNALDHPFGSGRGKRIKSKIAKRNAPPGAKVGHLRPKQTGRKK
ncbi:MAG: 50S ribosomal protein L2 [Candidatus Pacearchaeota archaeon]|jgi:large subunit ribosomal protein L2